MRLVPQDLKEIHSQLGSFHEEISVLVKKNPNEVLNKFKVKLINGLLERANAALSTRTPLPDFTQFDVDELPSASDAAVVLNVYQKAVWIAMFP